MVELYASSATAIARGVAAGLLSAEAVALAALGRIAAHDGRVGAFTHVATGRALAKARALDAERAAGRPLGPLAGVPFAVKNLFDLAGLPTLAGSRIGRDAAPAARDATLVERLEGAGAVCLGALNMGEYAYDFTGENAHDGPSRNPHDLDHMSGGSSGGSAAAVAAGFAPLSLGSDTNGSIRVPSSLCGIFGLKPTYGRLGRAGTFPFVASLDHLGPFARSAEDLALCYDALQGPDPDDAACAGRAIEPTLRLLERGAAGLRVAVAGGYFAADDVPDAHAAVARCAAILGATRRVDLPGAARARAAAFLITATEGAALHLDRLRARPGDFDPAVRDRLLAGAMVPAAWVAQAQKARRRFAEEAARAFDGIDVILAPATPSRAPRLGQSTMTIGTATLPVRANLGLYTQPISCIGLPVATVPIWLDEGLPIGVQVIAPPWREDLALRVAAVLEAAGAAQAPVARL
ncbi:AtzE family amidohydrolase [Lichenibacterium minor]|uniref:AtzE family amidohydrolase n=1 Tax=Lichenibacterium minor TaxID=2316528 RepID=A0A4Q2U1K4_9HYPH|nr:AtzE family amidohydrolase [Lichenibacterium minor]RYC30333.1 AtzE family amidohydrolase [Lichenibacterium minor]